MHPALAKDIADFEAALKLYAGRYDDPLFKRFRLMNGIYGQRQPGVQMARIKIPYGRLTPAQVRTLAAVGDTYSNGMGHVTDRQAVQYHFIELQKIPALLTELAKVDLTPREGCGNAIRNITGDELAGLAADEAFDIFPVVEQVFRYFLRHPCGQNLPRKFKIGFSGSAADRALVGINDFGGIAKVQAGVKGFEVFVGGGLGAIPHAAHRLADFVPADQICDFVEAAVRVFDRHGNRKNIYRARLKFLIVDLGFADFKKLFDSELADLRADSARGVPPIQWPSESVDSPVANSEFDLDTAEPALRHFYTTNVAAQKQVGLYSVYVAIPLGNYTTKELFKLADLAEKYCAGTPELRTTVRQKFLLPNVPGDKLAALFAELQAADLAEPDSHRAADIVACPGSDTCLLGITRSRGLARELRALFAARGWSSLPGLDIHINGCPNSCGQHRIAGLGFQGGSVNVAGQQLPAFDVLVGGVSAQAETRFGISLGRIPAHAVPAVAEQLITQWQAEAKPAEKFTEFARRVGIDSLKSLVEDHKTVPPEKLAAFAIDFGEDRPFKLEISSGECAGMVVSLLDVGLADAERELYLAGENPTLEQQHLAKALILAAKTVLIPEGLEPRDSEAWAEVEKNLIATGQLPAKWRDLPTQLSISSMREFLDTASELIDRAKLAIKGAANAKLDRQITTNQTPSEPELYDLTGVKCPMNYVKTKLKLEKMPSGSLLTVLLDAGEPKENVPLSVKADGHTILDLVEKSPAVWQLEIRKK